MNRVSKLFVLMLVVGSTILSVQVLSDIFLSNLAHSAEIQACVTRAGRIRIIGPEYRREVCKKKERTLVLNTTAPDEPQGVTDDTIPEVQTVLVCKANNPTRLTASIFIDNNSVISTWGTMIITWSPQAYTTNMTVVSESDNAILDFSVGNRSVDGYAMWFVLEANFEWNGFAIAIPAIEGFIDEYDVCFAQHF